MIKIQINKNGIEATGHSGYAPAGYDIICAGVTALCDAFILSARYDIEAYENNGYTKIIIKNPASDVEAKFSMLVTGLREIAEIFPDNVTIDDQAFTSIKDTSIQSSIETITR